MTKGTRRLVVLAIGVGIFALFAATIGFSGQSLPSYILLVVGEAISLIAIERRY